MLLLAANFGVHVRFLWFYLIPFYSVLQMSVLHLILYLGLFEIYTKYVSVRIQTDYK